jgi:fructose-specific phosphotransferase system IIC component
VVLAGALVAPYGAWDFDLVVLLVPLVAAAVKVSHAPRPGVVATAVVGLVLFVVASHRTTVGKYYVWMTPAVIAAYVWAGRVTAASPRPPRELRREPRPVLEAARCP